MKRWGSYLLLALLVCAVLYLPIHRELLDRGWIPASTFRASDHSTLTLYDNGKYEITKAGSTNRGTYVKETFPEAPWISLIRLDSGLSLHVPYDARVYRVEDIPELTGANVKFVR